MIENIWVWLKIYPFIILLMFVIVFLANPKISPIICKIHVERETDEVWSKDYKVTSI